MLTYRATLQPQSATRSPWQADTLFGHLCWLIRYQEGEPALEKFLVHYIKGQPPLLLSNGCPDNMLPRPLLPAQKIERGQSKQDQVKIMKAAKAGKGIRWVSLAEFDDFRRGDTVVLKPRLGVNKDRPILKNQINRLTFGTTPVDKEAGSGLYNVDELAFVDSSGVNPVGLNISIYVKVAGEQWADRAEELLNYLAKSGYGAKKSIGYGHFKLTNWERFTNFDEQPAGVNGFISLSNWVPAANDPTEGFYSTLVKYGKLGEEMAASDNPFKFPLIMLTAGSSFYDEGPVRAWYGRLVDNIAPADPRVVQYGYAFAVPAHLGN